MGHPQWVLGMKIEDVEKQIIEYTLQFYGGNKTKTAQSLGISVRTIDNKLGKWYPKKEDANQNTAAH